MSLMAGAFNTVSSFNRIVWIKLIWLIKQIELTGIIESIKLEQMLNLGKTRIYLC